MRSAALGALGPIVAGGRIGGARAVVAGLAGGVHLDPGAGVLPGTSVLQNITDGISTWALLIALAGLLVGAAAWAIGSHSQNYQQAASGRRAVITCALAALVVGAAPAIVNFFYATGQRFHA